MTMTIGSLAKAAGVKVSTLRYYERRGLLQPDARTEGNYRSYGSESVERLTFIRAAQRAGFTLTDIARLFDLRNGSSDPCCDVLGIIEQRLSAVTDQLRDLTEIQRILGAAVDWCHESAGTGKCQALDELGKLSQAPGTDGP